MERLKSCLNVLYSQMHTVYMVHSRVCSLCTCVCEFGLKWVYHWMRPNGDMCSNADKLIKLYVLIEHISPSKTSLVRKCTETRACQSIQSFLQFLVFADKEIENELRLYFSIYYDFNLMGYNVKKEIIRFSIFLSRFLPFFSFLF